MNTVNLLGRLTKDPVTEITPSGHTTVKFTLAVRKKFKNKQTGEYESNFINCIAWRGLAETIGNRVKKGEMLGLVGTWETRNYEGQDGRRVYMNECLVEDITFVGGNSSNSSSNTNTYQQNQNSNSGQNSPFNGGGQPMTDISDDDLPF
jgi:single-strand DNA-binding protein